METQTEKPKKTVVRKVKVLLTEEEKVKMGENLAHELSILEEIKERKKVITAQLSKDVKDKESDISKLKDCINLGYEFKEKDCEMVKNFDTGLKEFWLDGEIIETEQLTAMDYQLNLQEQEEANAAEEKRIEEGTAAFESNIIEAKGTAKTAKPKVSKKEKERFRELVASAETAMNEKRFQDAFNLYEDANSIIFDNDIAAKMDGLKSFL